MDIYTYRETYGLSQQALADMINQHVKAHKSGRTATQALVSQWELGQTGISPDRAIQLEAVTKGKLRKSQLRPDLWGRKRRKG